MVLCILLKETGGLDFAGVDLDVEMFLFFIRISLKDTSKNSSMTKIRKIIIRYPDNPKRERSVITPSLMLA